jgi:hypothetical protein
LVTAAASAALAAGAAPASAQIWDKLTNKKKTIVPIHHPPQLVLDGITRIAVMEFKGECGPEITEKVTDVVSRSQKYELVDRASLDAVLGEQSLQQSETVNAATTARLGQMLGAAVLVTGRITRCNTRIGEPRLAGPEDVLGKGAGLAGQGASLLGRGASLVGQGAGILGKGAGLLGKGAGLLGRGAGLLGKGGGAGYVVDTTTTVTGGMQVIDVTSGKVLARAPIQVDHVVQVRSESPYMSPADPEEVKTGGYAEVADVLTRLISGWDEQVAVSLHDDEKWSLKLSANQMRVGDLEGAIETLRASIEANGQGPGADPKMFSKALHNLGLALMLTDRLQEAEEALKRSSLARSNDDTVEALLLCRRAIAERAETLSREKGLASAAGPTAADGAKPLLTNDEVINMSRARLPEAVILSKIRSSTCEFDGSPAALVQLRSAGVTDNVLVAIVERSK